MNEFHFDEALELAKTLLKKSEFVREYDIAEALIDVYFRGMQVGVDRLSEQLQRRESK